MHAPNPSTVALFLLPPLIAWRIYARFKRMVGRQRLTKYRLWIQLSLFPALLLLAAWSASSRPHALAWLVAGTAAGAGLGLYGLKTTVFQPVPGNLFYTPNAHLGIALTLLFVLRIAYRFIELRVLNSAADPSMRGFVHSPLTLAAFGLLAGYYITYAIGLARWRARVLKAKRERLAREQSGA